VKRWLLLATGLLGLAWALLALIVRLAWALRARTADPPPHRWAGP